ncbi:MAG: hypothetical protein A3B71_04235 [Gammaproteobacteria bacterium RIFCSPHIGHO2_02_FULL_42_43]|nr:MAG: hypothetical protein A3B71_04235 [Gammaproteobacteria bacterium RIFCSPHIGHO2_02_FULL_42_43]
MLIEKQQLINEVQTFLQELKKNNPERESLEWYLINNLNRYLESLTAAGSAQEIKIATKILSRFCVDCMNWDTTLFKQCTKITHLGLKIAKNN